MVFHGNNNRFNFKTVKKAGYEFCEAVLFFSAIIGESLKLRLFDKTLAGSGEFLNSFALLKSVFPFLNTSL